MSADGDDWDLSKIEHEDSVSDRVRKVSVSLPESLTQRVRRLAGPGSFSRYVANALEHQVQQDELSKWLAEMEAEHGPVPQDITEEVASTWDELDRRFRKEGF
jgi:predicted transcriptional regulator